MPMIEFQADGSPASGYLAVPESGSGPAVVVMQEWWADPDAAERSWPRSTDFVRENLS